MRFRENRPDPALVAKLFAQSGKRHLLLTGTRGAGKTTLLNALAEADAPGLVTRAVPGEKVVLSDRLTGKAVTIGTFDPALPGRENRMVPLLEALSGEALAMLNACRKSPHPWAVIDEIGYLEGACPEYCRALEALMVEKHLLAAVRKQDIPFLQAILSREDACVIEL